ncbi:MAG: hydroxyacid dehydrogenase [Planctomycetales bacterium]|nr:hydroxyacid dehydrogenase [Planctomycetales bacterium]
MPASRRVLISDDLAPPCVEVLASRGIAGDYRPGISAEELAKFLAGAEGLLVRSRTKVTAAVFEGADSLRVVGRAGSGVDNVDVPAATAKGVLVMNVPGGNTRSVAEHAIALLLALLRRIPAAHASTSAGKWEKSKFEGREAAGKTLGIVGPGKIGREVAAIARALGMTPIASHPSAGPEASAKYGLPIVPLAELLARADAVTLHVPSTPRTQGMMNADAFRKMKRGAYLVNCARGDVVDEGALLAALDGGTLAGAAVDVFPVEPPPPASRLLSHPKVIVTPHIAASTVEAQERVALAIAEQVARYLVDGVVANAVNAPAPAGAPRK